MPLETIRKPVNILFNLSVPIRPNQSANQCQSLTISFMVTCGVQQKAPHLLYQPVNHTLTSFPSQWHSTPTHLPSHPHPPSISPQFLFLSPSPLPHSISFFHPPSFSPLFLFFLSPSFFISLSSIFCSHPPFIFPLLLFLLPSLPFISHLFFYLSLHPLFLYPSFLPSFPFSLSYPHFFFLIPLTLSIYPLPLSLPSLHSFSLSFITLSID